MALLLNPSIFGMDLTFILQKRHRVDYGCDRDDLVRILAELEGGSDPVAGDGSRRAASPVVSEG